MDPALSDPFDEERSPTMFAPIFRDPLGVILRRWKILLAGAALILTTATVLAIRTEPLFMAEATVSVLGARISENFVPTTVEIGTLDQISAIVSEVQSRKNLARIALAHEVLGAHESGESLEQVVNVVRERILVTAIEPENKRGRRNESSSVYALSFKDADSDRAAAVANELARSFIDVHLRLRSCEARVTTDFLRRELSEVEEELRMQEHLATEFKQQHRGELPGELAANMARLDRLQENRRVLVEQLGVLEARRANPENLISDDSPQTRLALLGARLNEALSLYTSDHPNVVALRRQVDALELELGIGGSPTVVGNPEESLVRTRLAEVETELAELDARVARTPKRQEQQEAIDQRLAVLRDSYTELLRKVDQAELSESVESAQHGVRVSILDQAIPPETREGSRILIMLAGLFGALGTSVVIAVLAEHLDAVIATTEQIESTYSLPVVGSVPHIS